MLGDFASASNTHSGKLALFFLGGQAGIGRGMKASLTRKPRSLKGTGGKRVPESFLEVPNHSLFIGCPYTGFRQRRSSRRKWQSDFQSHQ